MLDVFKRLKDVKEGDLHPKFKLLRDTVMLQGEKDILCNWTDGFEDRDNKIIKEFQTTFHSSFWEFYLFQVFKELNFKIDFKYDRPDFIVKYPQDFYIEAVVSNVKQNGKSEYLRTFEDISSMLVPPHKQKDFYEVLDEGIIRNSNAILSKSTKYLDKYVKCEWVDKDKPFVIALSSYSQINYGREHIYSMMALLYGAYFIPEIDRYEMRDVIKKETGSDVSLGLFNDKSFEHISAIIFSCTVTLGKLTSLVISNLNDEDKCTMNGVLNVRHDYEFPHYKMHKVSKENPEYLTDGLLVFHNPFAKSKLNIDLFKESNAVQVVGTESGISFIGENLPIYSRFNVLDAMLTKEIIDMISIDFNC